MKIAKMSEKWLFGTIREIPDMPDGTEAAVALDTDDDHALCIRSAPPNEGVWGTHFTIGWLEEEEEAINGLARVVASSMQRAYNQGRNYERAKTNSDLAGLHRLLERLDRFGL